MLNRILLPAAFGFIVLMVWTFVVNGVFHFNSRLTMSPPPDEVVVYEMLKDRIVDAGVYISNPEVEPGVGFPLGDPVFSITYSGFGHEAAGRTQLLQMSAGFLSMTLAAGLLSLASPRVLSRFTYRVLFIVGLGVLLALVGDVTRIGIGAYPVNTALLFAANRVAVWTLIGFVMAWATRSPAEVPDQS